MNIKEPTRLSIFILHGFKFDDNLLSRQCSITCYRDTAEDHGLCCIHNIFLFPNQPTTIFFKQLKLFIRDFRGFSK